MGTTERLLAEGGLSARAAEGWLTAIANAAVRRRETGVRDPRGYDSSRAGRVLIRLSRLSESKTPDKLLLQAGAIDGETDGWRSGFLAGMWDSFGDDDAHDLYIRSTGVLGRQARGSLARELFIAAFDPNFSDQRHRQLDRLLDALPEGEREQLLLEGVASAPADQRANVLGYVSSSRHAQGAEHLPLRMTAVLTLSGEQSDLAKRTSKEVADSIAHTVDASPANWSHTVSSPTVAVLRGAREQIDEVIRQREIELEGLRKSHEAELEQERQEQERLRQQVRQRNADLAARRDESKLEARRDMLLAIGEVLQSTRLGVNCEEAVDNVEAGLRLALKAGGAELLESAPEGYDVRLHRSEEELTNSTPVRVVAPGVIVRGETDDDLVLLKAKVSREAG